MRGRARAISELRIFHLPFWPILLLSRDAGIRDFAGVPCGLLPKTRGVGTTFVLTD
jgi:hypothetical protein